MPWKTAWQHTAVFFPGESHGRRSLVGYSPWGRKESTHWVTKRWKETQASKNILRRNRHVQKGSGRKEKRGWERGREGERKVKVKSLSCVWLFATLWTVAHQPPPPMGFSRKEYWSGLPFLSPGDLPDPGIFPTQGSNPGLLHCRQILYHLS